MELQCHKIKIVHPINIIKIQKRLFKLGYRWIGQNNNIIVNEIKTIFIHNNRKMSYTNKYSHNLYKDYKYIHESFLM